MVNRSRIVFRPTPPAKPQKELKTQETASITIKNGTLVAEGPGSHSWSNMLLVLLLLGVPFFVNLIFGGNKFTYIAATLVLAIPILMAFWTINSAFGPRLDTKTELPNSPIEEYLEFLDEKLAQKYRGSIKIPLETFQELFIDGKVVPKGGRDILDVLELRHDWASFRFTFGLFKYFLLQMLPEVILHSRSQDEEQVRGHYDRGDDFYAAFLGPRMIYTSGIISDESREESLEEMQDTKLRLVCEKLELTAGESLLDIGCGWGTLVAYATSIYGADATGITLGRNQCAWGNHLIEKYAGRKSQSTIVCADYRDIPAHPTYNKISCLEMAEHVGVRKFHGFLRQVYDLLDDDGLFFMQIVGMRKCWQFEDLTWGLFMNKYIFPGADATLPIGAVTEYLTGAGFEIKSVDNITIHYSATIWRWYRNWLSNKSSVSEKYGIRWYRIWELFLAWATIVARQGSAHAYQIVCNKDKNSFQRINGIKSQHGTYLFSDETKTKKWQELNKDVFN